MPRSAAQWGLGLRAFEKGTECYSFGIPNQTGQYQPGLIKLWRIKKKKKRVCNENIGTKNEGKYNVLTTVCQNLKEKQFLGLGTESK